MIPNALTIAGSDPSGGAGIQADLKTFAALGTYGMSVVTALTAQNTRGVRSVRVLDAGFVAEQLDALYEDIRVDTVKIGMVGSVGVVDVIADRLSKHPGSSVVLDPVMIAKSGDRLLAEEAVVAMRDRLIPLARLITPNLPEAAALIGGPVPETLADMVRAVRLLHRLGSDWVLLKGGASGRRRQSRSSVRRPDADRVAGSPNRDKQHARNGLHAFGRDRRVAAAPGHGECGAAGQDLPDRRAGRE